MLDGITAHAMAILSRGLTVEYSVAMHAVTGAIYEAAKAGKTWVEVPEEALNNAWMLVRDELERRGFGFDRGSKSGAVTW